MTGGGNGIGRPVVLNALERGARLAAVDIRRDGLDEIEDDRLHIYVGRDSRMMSLLDRAAPERSTHVIYRQMKGRLGR